jgi:hypothetical protein
MNSRDAAYEREIELALNASKMETPASAIAEDGEAEAIGEKPTTELESLVRKGKRKREDDDTGECKQPRESLCS